MNPYNPFAVHNSWADMVNEESDWQSTPAPSLRLNIDPASVRLNRIHHEDNIHLEAERVRQIPIARQQRDDFLLAQKLETDYELAMKIAEEERIVKEQAELYNSFYATKLQNEIMLLASIILA